ncbi:hypothetical protein [Candidatus Ichthyocystis sparus]|uniref:hypothetical protein n=1 Tax=Candidatus Ichthyocystis sparus TaxID=1561004 RepID=UPI000B81A9D3|nr:hypothetical protein [Candidatus Ichthyocystis sparus]
MKKKLSIVAAVVSTLLVAGCFDINNEDDHKKTDSLSLKQLIEYGSATNTGPAGLYIKDDGTLVAVGPGSGGTKSGEIFVADPGSSDLVAKIVKTTGIQTYFGFHSLTYSPTRDSFFICSNPKIASPVSLPTVVEFKVNQAGEYAWTSVMNLGTPGIQPNQICKSLAVIENRIFVINASAIDDRYPAMYWADLPDKAAPSANMKMAFQYSQLGLKRSQLLRFTLMDMALEKDMPLNMYNFYLLDRGRNSIDKVSLVYNTTLNVMELRDVIPMGYDPISINEPSALVNLNNSPLPFTIMMIVISL